MSMRAVDYLFADGRIVTTIVDGVRKSVLVNIGAGSENAAGDIQGTSEGSTREPLYGQIGIVTKPEAPTSDGFAEVVSIRNEDGLTPIAGRDLRLSALVPNDVQVAVVQHGGGFLGLSYAQTSPTKAGTKARLYAPAPTPGQAHELVMDPAGPTPTIKLTHINGNYIELTPTTITIGNVTAQSLAYADALFEFVAIVKKLLSTPSVNGAAPVATLTPSELATFTAYPSLVPSKTTILYGT